MNEYQFLPSLSLDEYEALRESIRENGVIEPVITDEGGAIIDGHHRVKICAELDIDYPTRVLEGLSEEQKQDLSLELNMHRRHLTKEQKKELAIGLREQGWTQERISKALGTPRRTIADWLGGIAKVDQPSPREEPPKNPEAERLREEIAYYEARSKEQEKVIEELQSREPQVIEKVIKPDPEEIERIIAERTTARMSELDRREAALHRKSEEIAKATEAQLDVAKLQKEIIDLRKKAGTERADFEVRQRMRKGVDTLLPVAGLLGIVENEISKANNCCGFSLEELERYRQDFLTLTAIAQALVRTLDSKIAEWSQGGGLSLVQND